MIGGRPSGWQTPGDVETWPVQWATEVLSLVREAYSRVNIGEAVSEGDASTGLRCKCPVVIDRGYTRWANEQALTQLGKAGYRLAALLQAVFEKR